METRKDSKTYTTNDIAKFLNIHTQTVRNWEYNYEMKIKRDNRGFRCYELTDFKVFVCIATLRNKGYEPLKIKELLEKIKMDTEEIKLEEVQNFIDSQYSTINMLNANNVSNASKHDVMDSSQNSAVEEQTEVDVPDSNPAEENKAELACKICDLLKNPKYTQRSIEVLAGYFYEKLCKMNS